MGQAEAAVTHFNSVATSSGGKTSALAGAFGTVEKAASKVGGALSHAGNQIKNLVTGPLGIIGLTGGLLSFGGAIQSTLGKLNDLAFGTEKLQALTGGSAQNISVLIAATEKYGISLDKLTTTAAFYEKNVNKVISKNKDLAKILTDSTGKALPFDQALLAIADVYQKSTDKAAAAAVAASLFGRSYAGLVPILAQGRQGILDLETEAAKMGLQLSESNVADFAKYRTAIRDSQEAISGLQVAIGLDLLPTIIDLAHGVQSFVTDHKTDIVNFFHNAVGFAKQAAGAISGFVGVLTGAWSSIPGPLRDMLTTAFVGDRIIKFIFGIDPAGAALGALKNALITGAAGGFGKSLTAAGIGKLFVQPVFVTNPGFGGSLPGLPGAAGAAGAAAEGVGGLALAAGALAIPLGIAIAAGIKTAFGVTDAQQQYAQTHGQFGPRSYSNVPNASAFQDADKAAAALANLDPSLSALEDSGRSLRTRFDELSASVNASTHTFRDRFGNLGSIISGIEARSAARFGHSLGAAAVNDTFQRDLLREAGKIVKGTETGTQKLIDLKQIQSDLRQHGDRVAAHKLDVLIAKQKAINVSTTVNIQGQAVYRVTSTTYAQNISNIAQARISGAAG